MTLSLETVTIADPDGHGAALALKGDWIVVAVGDGDHIGLGEASHSRDDAACLGRIATLFEGHVRSLTPSLEVIHALHRGPFARAGDFVTATAISALDQALHDLVARRAGVPVWKLFVEEPVRRSVPVYVTLNRALGTREDRDYREAVERVLEMGIDHVKVAPFENVTPDGDQLVQARSGLDVLKMLRATFPELGVRVDFHERFTPANALALLPEFEGLGLEWIEVPCPIGPTNAEIRLRTGIPLAAGEFFFGTLDFIQLAGRGWADVVMPDVKHVGGFGPLLEICEAVQPFAVAVSPHNPSGDVSTLATLHAAALAGNTVSIELPLHSRSHTPAYSTLVRDGELYLPTGPGWGLDPGALLAGIRGGTMT